MGGYGGCGRIVGAGGAGAPSVALCESALAILWPRRNRGEPAARLACRALIRGWLMKLKEGCK